MAALTAVLFLMVPPFLGAFLGVLFAWYLIVRKGDRPG